MNKIALAMIVKGEGEEYKNLDRALSSIAPYVDGIFITLTGDPDKVKQTEEVCEKYRAHVSYTKALWTADKKAVNWLKDFFGYEPHMKVGENIFLFDEARNFNFSQVSHDYEWILWMDSDDYFIGGENLRKVADIALKGQIEATYFNYIYQSEYDENYKVKHVLIEHLRERLVKNSGIYKWVGNIHETLIEQRPSRKTDNYDCSVLHLATTADRNVSLRRNLTALELAIYRSEGKDPRHVYYLAKAFYDLNTPEYDDKTVPLINTYLKGEHKSGWPEERSQACEYLAEIYRRRGEHNNAIKACMNALIESPENPSIFINIAATYMMKQDWDKALFWVKLASSVPDKKTTLVRNPKDLQVRTLQILYNCCLNQAKIDEAWAAAMKMFELLPDDPDIAHVVQFVNNLRMERDVTKKIVDISNILKQSGERGKIKALLSAVPNFVSNNPFIADLYKQNNPPKYWADDEVMIYCGPGFTQWSAKQLTNPGGSFVGGSEEAVIHMAEELTKLGWKVTVYGDPGADEGEINGVNWLPYYKFNKLDHFNIVVSWRQLGFFDQELNYKKAYLWNHDIQNPLEYTPERVQKISKAIFLSQWHRENVPDLPDDKVMLSSNGI